MGVEGGVGGNGGKKGGGGGGGGGKVNSNVYLYAVPLIPSEAVALQHT